MGWKPMRITVTAGSVCLAAIVCSTAMATSQPMREGPEPGPGSPRLTVGRPIEGNIDSAPNFLFILADDMGWGDLGVYGHPQIRTPEIDGLAAQGILFTHYYAMSPVCSPTRASLMTGRFPAEVDIRSGLASTSAANATKGQPNYLDPDLYTLPDLLRSAGYITGLYGKWHLGHTTDAPDPGAYGLDEHLTMTSVGPHLSRTGSNLSAVFGFTNGAVDEALDFLDRHQSQRFFLSVWMVLPHTVLDPTEEQMAQYLYSLPPGVADRGSKAVYYSSISEVDRQVGRLLAKLEELNLASTTMVVLTSDNGPEDIYVREATHSGIGSTGPFRGRKRSLYEGGVRMPLIVRLPGMTPPGSVNDSVVASVDFLPTIAALAGESLPPSLIVDGEDVSQALQGSSIERTDPLMWEISYISGIGPPQDKSPVLAMRDGPWKLLMNPDGQRKELFDITADPEERTDLSGSTEPAIQATLQEMGDALLLWHSGLAQTAPPLNTGTDGWNWPVAASVAGAAGKD
jgi:N-acetylgalactosamine-6-sulfatase